MIQIRNIFTGNVMIELETFIEADLHGASLSGANFDGVDLRWADLRWADLNGASFHGADLHGASLSGASLREADISGADLHGADLSGASLRDIKFNAYTAFYTIQCPDEGAFIAFKKASNKIVKLLITEDALRSSATTAKCRASKAKVLEIQNLDGTKSKLDVVNSNYDKQFLYIVGETIEVPNFDTNRWNECSSGIHFFINREMAVQYE